MRGGGAGQSLTVLMYGSKAVEGDSEGMLLQSVLLTTHGP